MCKWVILLLLLLLVLLLIIIYFKEAMQNVIVPKYNDNKDLSDSDSDLAVV